jgi:uncharacterized protein YndB with AHSA1/START domain
MAGGRTDKAERWIAAPPPVVFACWTDPATLVRWLPPAGMTGRIQMFDPRPSGPFRIVLAYDDTATQGKAGDGTDVIAGQFVVFNPPTHLAFTSRFHSEDPLFAGEMRMDWHYESAGSGTQVRIVASNVPPGISAEDHAAGMSASLAQLAALLERSSGNLPS